MRSLENDSTDGRTFQVGETIPIEGICASADSTRTYPYDKNGSSYKKKKVMSSENGGLDAPGVINPGGNNPPPDGLRKIRKNIILFI